MFSDGMSMFVGDDVLRAKVFSIIGEVKQMLFDCFNHGHTVLLLGRPTFCVAVTNLFWWQQVLVVEKVELVDLNVDQGLCIVCIFVLIFWAT